MNYICRVLDYMAWFWFMEWLILVYIINRIIHGRLEIWNLSSCVHIRYLTRSLRSLVRYRCEHSKINSISPRDHVLFSIFCTWLPGLMFIWYLIVMSQVQCRRNILELAHIQIYYLQCTLYTHTCTKDHYQKEKRRH